MMVEYGVFKPEIVEGFFQNGYIAFLSPTVFILA